MLSLIHLDFKSICLSYTYDIKEIHRNNASKIYLNVYSTFFLHLSLLIVHVKL